MTPAEVRALELEVVYPLRCRAGLCIGPPHLAGMAEIAPGGAALRWAWCLPGDAEPWGWGRTALEARSAAAAELGRLSAALGAGACDPSQGYPVAVVAWSPGRAGVEALDAVGLSLAGTELGLRPGCSTGNVGNR